jgi:SNF2 family DNA or RNA helicase
MLLAWRQGSSYLQLAGGAGWAKLPTEWLREHGAALERFIAAVGEKEFAPGRLISEVGELCDSLRIEPPEYFKRLKSGLAEVESIPDAELPRDLRADLRKYQRTGINWISFLHRHGLGALLADDMGLGKTLQALCVVSGRTLVVCPTSVLASWRQQIELFRPSLTVSVYHGSRRELAQDVDVILTSYALLRLDIDRLIETEWDLVVLDEAQTIRNPSSQVAQAAYRLRAKKRLSLSGTPVENSLDDLWSHFRFLNPGLLGDYQQFQQRFVQPIELGQVGPTQELRKRSMPFIMRRLKRDVASELPPKTEVVLECELSDRERIVYESVLGMIKDDVLEALDSNRGVFSVLEVLLRLRQACCHIGLLPGHQADSSSKIDLLIESLQGSKAHGHRALVFSQWTTLLDRIEPHLERHSISFCRIDGSTADRGDLVNSFQSPDGPDVMLLSLKAGGLGVTLTAADHVYIVDPWWNPAAEDQAADRAYRIGQNNPVFVHRLVAKDTIEERIIQIQQEKRALLAAAIGESGSLALSREDVLRILAV